MKILIAPDSFKESLSALEVAQHIAAGVRRVFPEAVIQQVPLSDGGEGLTESLTAATVSYTHLSPEGNVHNGAFPSHPHGQGTYGICSLVRMETYAPFSRAAGCLLYTSWVPGEKSSADRGVSPPIKYPEWVWG